MIRVFPLYFISVELSMIRVFPLGKIFLDAIGVFPPCDNKYGKSIPSLSLMSNKYDKSIPSLFYKCRVKYDKSIPSLFQMV